MTLIRESDQLANLHLTSGLIPLLGQAKYICSLASAPACLLASPLQADMGQI